MAEKLGNYGALQRWPRPEKPAREEKATPHTTEQRQMLILVCRTKVSIQVLWPKHNVSHAQVKSAILVKFGQRVRQERTRRGLSQEQLAELAGVHRTYIGMIERAEKNITLESIEKLAKALDLTPEELLRADV
ncbi:MAG: helix-turn-helix transcriptional regulator [Syntrophobacteraceae bacterium]